MAPTLVALKRVRITRGIGPAGPLVTTFDIGDPITGVPDADLGKWVDLGMAGAPAPARAQAKPAAQPAAKNPAAPKPAAKPKPARARKSAPAKG